MQKLFGVLFHGPLWRTFLLMGGFGWLFVVTSYNLVVQVAANFNFVSRHGVMALLDGGLYQFAELTVYGYLSLCFYILFKGCLHGILERITGH